MIRKKNVFFHSHPQDDSFWENINIGYLKLDIAEAKTKKNKIKTMFDLMQLWTSTVFNYYNLSKNFGSFASKDATFIPSFMERHFTSWTKTGFVSLILWCPSQSWSDPNSQITLRYLMSTLTFMCGPCFENMSPSIGFLMFLYSNAIERYRL